MPSPSVTASTPTSAPPEHAAGSAPLPPSTASLDRAAAVAVAPRPRPCFPDARFPSGVTAPVGVVVVGLLLLAALAAIGLRTPGERTVAAPELAAQRAAASRAAADVAGQARQTAEAVTSQLVLLGPLVAGDPAAGAAAVERAVSDLRGVAVVDATGSVLAARGTPPVEKGLPPARPVVTTTPGGPVRAVVSVPVAPGRAVVASTDLRLPPPAPGLHTKLVSTTGAVLDAAGPTPAGDLAREDVLVGRVASEASTDDEGDLADTSALADSGRDPLRPVVSGSFAAVDLPPAAMSVPVAAVAFAAAPAQVGAATHPGIPLAIGLVGLALLVGAALWRGLVEPIRRLRAGTDAAVIDPHGAPLVPRSFVRELDAVALAVRRATSPPGPAPTRVGGVDADGPRRRVGARAVVLGVAVLLVGLIVPGAVAAASGFTGPDGSTAADDTAHVDATHRHATEAAEDLRRRIDAGASAVREAAAPRLAVPASTNLSAGADAVAAIPSLFRSVAVVDETGVVVHRAGRPALRTTEPVPPGSGVAQLNTAGRLPLLVAHASAPTGGYALVAEYDVTVLTGLLQREDTRTRVVDAGHRVVLQNGGFEAFTALADPGLRAAATVAESGSAVVSAAPVEGVESALVSLPLGGGDAAAQLGWVLVADRDRDAGDLRNDTATRAALVVGGLGMALAIGTLAWLRRIVVVPLRRVERALADEPGPHGSALPVMHLDEVGAIVANLNVLRRAGHQGGR